MTANKITNVDTERLTEQTEMTQRKRDAHTALLLFGAFLVLYILTRTRVHIYADDSIRWAIAVETGHLVHQHHALYLLVGRAFFDLARLLGLAERPLVPLQVLSAFFGALGISFFYLTLRRIGSGAVGALLTTLSLAFTFGFWGYAMVADVYVLETTAMILGAFFLTGLLQKGPDSRVLYSFVCSWFWRWECIKRRSSSTPSFFSACSSRQDPAAFASRAWP